MNKLHPVLALAPALMLAACGGAGSDIASAPPPPAPPQSAGTNSQSITMGSPLASTPATTAGTYNVIGVATSWDKPNHQAMAGGVATGDLRITVDPASNRYTLTLNPAAFPEATPPNGKLTYTISEQGYGHNFVVSEYVNGVLQQTTAFEGRHGLAESDSADTDPKSTQFESSLGQSHVSLGKWIWRTALDDGAGGGYDAPAGEIRFVYGDRTPASGIPVSGTASYAVQDRPDYELNLTADFGQRTIAAVFGLLLVPPGSWDNAYHLDLSGSAPIRSAGDFDITLSGTKLPGIWNGFKFAPSAGPPVAERSGMLSGAFFGPDASQIGATLLFPTLDGGMNADAFIAVRN